MSSLLTDVPPGKVAFVVTSLEMRERPPLRPDSRDASWHLNRVTDPDPDWYRGLYRRVGLDWLWFSRLRVSDEQLLAVIRHPMVQVYALLQDQKDVGLLELDFRDTGQCELSFFGLVAEMFGTRAGRWLMNRAIERVWDRGTIERFWVHTCTGDHPAALGFYMRSGFRPYRRQIEIADDPRLTGNLPRSAAPQIPIL